MHSVIFLIYEFVTRRISESVLQFTINTLYFFYKLSIGRSVK